MAAAGAFVAEGQGSFFNRVRSSQQRGRNPQRVQASVQLARELVGRAEGTLADPVGRRVLLGEAIPQEEEIYAVFEEHRRW